MKPNKYLIIGSYSSPEEEGIKLYSFNQNTGEAKYLSGLKGISNPSFQYLNKTGTRLYSVAEDDEPSCSASFIKFDKKLSKLTLINTLPTSGASPCNIILSPDEKKLYTANYMGGSLTEYKLNEDSGELVEKKVLKFTGTGPNKERQEQPHIHAINFTPDHKFLLANDLGTDQIHMFPIDKIDYSNKKDVFLRGRS